MIQIEDIKVGAKFRTDAGVVWSIDLIQQDEKFGTLVSTSTVPGVKGNYRDDIENLVDFLNEEESEKID